MHLNLFVTRKFSSLRQSHLYVPTNSKIKGLVQQGHFSEALQLYTRQPHCPLNTTKFTFPSLLKSCAFLSNLSYGKTLHATVFTLGLQFDPYITASLINMYVKCGSLGSAVQVFDKMCECEALAPDITIWNSMIDGYFRYGYIDEGILQFRRMQLLGVRPDAYSLSIMLGVCDSLPRFLEGKRIHGFLLRNMFDDDPFLVTALIEMYSNCGRPVDAWCVFERLENKNNVVVWNAMIGGLCENGLWENSLELYSLVKNENLILVSASFSSALAACSRGEDVELGKQVHNDVIKMGFQSDPYVCTSLLTMYAKCRLVEDAEKVFASVQDRKSEFWNAMISAYLWNGCAYDALAVRHQMRLDAVPSDSFTISNLLGVCSAIGLYDYGRTLHGELIKRPIKSTIAVQSALLTMYSKCGKTEDANAVFTTMKDKDMVAWGSMISGFCQNKKFKEALDLFKVMEADRVRPDSDIMASLISCSVELENIHLGCGIHGFVIKSGFESDSFVGSSLMDMYSKYGSTEMAEKVFSGMLHKNLVVWNSMIACYCRNDLPELSINIFPQIVQQGLYPDSVSITSILVAVSSVAALLKGKTIHGYQIRLAILSDLQVENALIDMYIKCGCLKYAKHIFLNMPQKNLVTWNSMIAGYGSHGECLKAISLFDEMKRLGIRPDDITFLSLISSCNHSGLVDEGLKLFQSMRVEYNIEPMMEHYVNIVDLLGRAGCLNDAYSFIRKMPIEPDRSVWLCLLSACRAHRNTELGELAAHNLLKMEPNRGSNYVQLLNLYVEARLPDKAAKLRASMRQRGLKKIPGCSWIEVRNKVDTFFSGDSSSPRTVEIYQTLSSLRSIIDRQEVYHECLEAF
ncbi:pentatricopeptide repeat-containing protein At2g40720 [Cornus florida]|uniref:pentatricopeptide repeat-containing protein At2g40720 n=1 Tax=Cornus florida TaxID=4283 RepID=UPI00289FB9D1|nr:pentatricopeptide repeat-containing protein At2g40720 [Cornus florida]